MAGIKPGDTFTLEQLLYGLMIPSGNDAANAIADHIAGSTDAFVEKMNAKAKELGATHTHFVNANGLHSTDHYTTAYDLYLISTRRLNCRCFVRSSTRSLIQLIIPMQMEPQNSRSGRLATGI